MRTPPTSKQSNTPLHLSGNLHVTGQSRFIGEMLPSPQCLALKPVPSQYAHAKIRSIDASAAQSIPGVIAILTHRDIPGENMIGHVLLDEPLFPVDEVQYIGQPIALVVAETARIAELAASKVNVEYENLHPVLTTAEAIERDLLYVPARHVLRGNIEEGFAAADHILEDELHLAGQEHFYLETQRCIAIPGENGEIVLQSATQSTSEVQEICAKVLGKHSKDITIEVPRLGGGFGGKERTPVLWSCLTALAAAVTGKPTELILTRHEDMRWTGKRHPFDIRYRIGFTKSGKITAYEVELNANGGAYCDLSLAILDRAVLHADNCYFIPNVKITGRACRTNLPPNTAMRGFGAPQGIFAIESAITRIAEMLKIDPFTIRIMNSYSEGQTTPFGQQVHEAATVELLERLRTDAEYDRVTTEVNHFNLLHHDVKRGIGVMPTKFGISFTATFLNQGSALVWIYTDGSISLSHGGIEMGQELNTKVAQVVARELGVSLSRIRVETANTKRVGNASPTAASSGSDINGNAARIAAKILRDRLTDQAILLYREKWDVEVSPDEIVFEADTIYSRTAPEHILTFPEVVHYAYMNRIALGAHGYYRTPNLVFDRVAFHGSPFAYFVFGCALAVVELKLMDGTFRIVSTHIVHETGRSLNPEIDRGQIEGAFIQGMGWCTFEELAFHPVSGEYLAVSPSTYKIPTIKDLPETFIVDMVDCDREHASVYQSKAIGEPPLIYGEAVFFAIKDALSAAVNHSVPIQLSLPATPNAVLLAHEHAKKSINRK